MLELERDIDSARSNLVHAFVCVCVYAGKEDQLEKDLKMSKATERAKDKEVDEAWKK